MLEGEPRIAKQNGVDPHPWGIAAVVSFYVLQDTDFFAGQAFYKKYSGMGEAVNIASTLTGFLLTNFCTTTYCPVIY
ncbi:hypothetical protein KFZ76_19885 [Methylovulum psychrotolerans]|uniref:hypothetical protein n=1 Tax=Methylovulum psychrotolerans TaxID=1704499 RepID=UPI001BFF0E23|nr:hypothetical protein [Methylovulum psychrotolerans]MBT9099964.1 hypothetical protein [Methylovulum psychrotolerans]